MTAEQLKIKISEHFPYELTGGQSTLLGLIAEFMLDREERNLFVIKGYAGTGKTTIVKAIADVLVEYNHGIVLLAPTGRSAKVLSNYSGRKAFTIHKKIYKLRSANEGLVQMALMPNIHKNTLFIIDEASMIANSSAGQEGSLFGGRALLDDLMEYVYNGSNCRLILIGDTAQLPPVGMDISPALDLKFLQSTFGIKIRSFELTEVVRQEMDSGILFNATAIRKIIASQKQNVFPKFKLDGFADIVNIRGDELEDALNDAYATYRADETIVVCRSNKRANLFNGQIRSRIIGRDSELTGGDMLMAVKNNYFWLSEDSKAGFIANGEMLEVQRLKAIKELYGFRFAEASVRLKDYPDENSFDTLLLIDTLNSETPALTSGENKKLYDSIMEDYEETPSRRKRMQQVRENKYFNALQVKFAWALTCHKSQGGQWKAVFIEQGYLKDGMINREYLRWLYTALTRATEKVYLVNFDKKFFEEESE
jgi:ATP-dependent exoDNAse (exonuclease V) alpha subunit